MIGNSLHCVPFAQYPNYRFLFDPVLNYTVQIIKLKKNYV